MKKICKLCGELFQATSAQVKAGGGKYCSLKCKYRSVKKKRVKKKCSCCKKEIWKRESRIKNNRNFFCSRNCYNKWRTGQILVDRKKRICKLCKKEFYIREYCIKKGQGVFCSKKCHSNWMRKKIERNCENCKKSFIIKPSIMKYGGGIFCSRECYHKWYSGKNSPHWQGGKSFELYGMDFNKKLKKFIRNRDNYSCQECDYTEKELKYTLHVHHIDYNKKNNDPNNLISLCNSCHSQTNFRRNNWIDYFQDKVGEHICGKN